MNAYLLLANGMVFAGQSVGAEGVTVGEVVFATGMVGFQETLTDPSYYGQIITQTYPLIGNYGMNKDDMESDRIWAKGYIVREACTTPSNWRCEETLDSFLKKNNTIGIEGIDTRHLTRIIRESGVMNGAILTTFDPADPANKAETEALLAQIRAYAVTDAVKNVTCEKPEVFNPQGETHIVLMHYGCKRNIVRCLVKRGCKVTVMPAFATAEEIKALAPDGIMLSNGPGDPAEPVEVIENLKHIFELNIPQIMSVMSALVLSVLVGLAATWTNSKLTCDFLGEFQNIVLDIVGKIIIPMLPFYIAATFCNLSYEGMITHQLPAFIQIILIVMAGHYIWLAVLYLLAGAYSGKNPWEVLRHYGPAYLTAVGTMSSAATLAVALDCARKSKVLRKDMVSFGIPLFANIHLCGSVLTEVFFCMTISKILYGHLPSIGTMLLFCALLGIFAIGAPGVPGGTVMASLGLITGVLMFDDAGTALMLAIFALQDSFGTACNVTGDGALTLMLTGYAEKHGIKNNDNIQSPVL